MQPDLEILSATIQAHARELALKEWEGEHKGLLPQILKNAELIARTLTLDDREVPTEVITKAIRERFLEVRTKALIEKLTARIVTEAGRKILDDEEHQTGSS